MRLFINNLIVKSHVSIILGVIAFFSVASFYSCLQIMETERQAIISFKFKSAEIEKIEFLIDDLKSKLVVYLKQEKSTPANLNEISDLIYSFQEALINFNTSHQGSLRVNMHDADLINDLQKEVSHLIPFIRRTVDGMGGQYTSQVKIILDEIEKKFQKFAKYQMQSEEHFLSEGVLQERRTKIFLSLSILGFSSFFLIIFLIYKNTQLEREYKRRMEINDIAHQRIQAIEASTDGIGIMDKDKNLLYMNPALRELHGIAQKDAGEYIGKSWKALYNDKGQAHIEGNVYPILNETGTWRGGSLIKRKDDKVIEAEMTLTLLPDGKGMIGTARDVTQKNQAERDNRELQGQIHQAQKMEAIGRLAGGLAHDFNNVLAAIMGYAEFLSEDLEKNKKLQKFADNILMAGNKGRALIDQMLAFSRRKEHQISVVNLRDAIDETVSMVSAGLPKSIDLSVDFHHDAPAYINGDASQISQALMNIVVNAVDAMEEEKGHIHISLFLIEPDEENFEGMICDEFLPDHEMPHINIQDIGDGQTNLEMGVLKRDQTYFQISISDTGSGMSEAILQHIFEPFFTTKAVDKGTGLGMANVHAAIVAHQAAMIIDTRLSEGSTFDLFFPQAQYINDLNLLDINHNHVGRTDFQGIRVLLVDDQQEVLDMMETLLSRAGFDCVAKQSSLEALELLREASDAFDLVITDQNMPKMTGVELIEKCVLFNRRLPFIILSGYSEEKLQNIRIKYPSIRATLRKPAKKDVLLKAIDSVLKETLL